MLAGVHEIGHPGPGGAQLFGDLAPCFVGTGPIGLIQGLPDRCGNNGVLAARDMRQGIPYPVTRHLCQVASKTRAMAD